MNPHTDLDLFPETVDQPDNSDLVNPAAATINTPTDGALDRTFWLFNRVSTIPAINWNAPATPGDALDNANYNRAEGRWYAAKSGASDKVYYSRNWGRSWVLDSRPVSGIAVRDIASDLAGNMVLCSLAAVTIYDYNSSAGTFTSRNAITGSPAGAIPIYSAGPAKWVIVYRNGTSGIGTFNSSDRATWTTHTSALPSTFTGYTGTNNAQAGVNAAGDIVAILNTSTTTDYKGAHSDDGGVIWTAFTIGTSVNASIAKPVYSEQEQLWMALVYDTAGEKVEIWTSTSGFGGWTKVYNNTPGSFVWVGLACVGKCFFAVGTSGQIYYSIDRGVTWRNSGNAPLFVALANLHLIGGGEGAMLLDDSTPATSSSHRFGLPGGVV